MRLEPLENPVGVLHPTGYPITGYLADFPIALSLPKTLPSVKTVSTVFSLIPPPLNELQYQQGQRIARGETDWAGAAIAYLETAVADKERWLISPAGYPRGWGMWAEASGYKEGRKARYLYWPSLILNWTTVPLSIIALRILRGEVSRHGVLPSEACFGLGSFLDEAAQYVGAAAIDLGMSGLRKGSFVLALLCGEPVGRQIYAVGLGMPAEQIARVRARLPKDTIVMGDADLDTLENLLN